MKIKILHYTNIVIILDLQISPIFFFEDFNNAYDDLVHILLVL